MQRDRVGANLRKPQKLKPILLRAKQGKINGTLSDRLMLSKKPLLMLKKLIRSDLRKGY